MTDVREAVIARMHAVMLTVAGFKTRERNRLNFTDAQLPAVSVLEGDEIVSDDDAPRTRPSARPYIVTAQPQVFIRTGGDGAGTEMNNLRADVIKALTMDEELNALSVNGRGVTYAGMESTLHAGRWSEMPGTALMFAITYKLDPNQI